MSKSYSSPVGGEQIRGFQLEPVFAEVVAMTHHCTVPGFTSTARSPFHFHKFVGSGDACAGGQHKHCDCMESLQHAAESLQHDVDSLQKEKVAKQGKVKDLQHQLEEEKARCETALKALTGRYDTILDLLHMECLWMLCISR